MRVCPAVARVCPILFLLRRGFLARCYCANFNGMLSSGSERPAPILTTLRYKGEDIDRARGADKIRSRPSLSCGGGGRKLRCSLSLSLPRLARFLPSSERGDCHLFAAVLRSRVALFFSTRRLLPLELSTARRLLQTLALRSIACSRLEKRSPRAQ